MQRRLAQEDASAGVKVELAGRPVDVALCGFGLAGAGVGAAFALARRQASAGVSHAYLVGIAGTYRPRVAPIGSVVAGGFARCVGIGAGSGPRHVSAEAMGWAHDTNPLVLPDSSLIRHRPSARGGTGSHVTPHSLLVVPGGLLSVTAASGSRYEAARRARAHPDAMAEEMEAYAVALAAQRADVPLTVLRGISNVAGDRDASRWRSREALAAVRDVLEQLLAD